ncbi:MAG: hypothetical protein VX438_17375 [Planctomycetota bacterium]|nr:hypothetical protein [Planctomycetota bacterium]
MDKNLQVVSKIFGLSLVVLGLLLALAWSAGKTVISIAQNPVQAGVPKFGGTDPEQVKSVQPANPKQKSTSGEIDLAVLVHISQQDSRSTNRKNESQWNRGPYNLVYAKKPSVPSRFGGSKSQDGSRIGFGSGSQFSTLGLIGIPTLVFSLLFVVMWGIISGKIQRILF